MDLICVKMKTKAKLYLKNITNYIEIDFILNKKDNSKKIRYAHSNLKLANIALFWQKKTEKYC